MTGVEPFCFSIRNLLHGAIVIIIVIIIIIIINTADAKHKKNLSLSRDVIRLKGYIYLGHFVSHSNRYIF